MRCIQKMRIEIKRFKKFDNAIFDFSEGKLNLLSGTSGVGKSTIFEAIRYCLYSNVSHFYPMGYERKEPTEVRIVMRDFSITRSYPPKKLKIEIGGGRGSGGDFLNPSTTSSTSTSIEDEEAQKVINSIFGDSTLFSITSYISQGERNPLISSSNSAKMEMIEKIVFDESSSPEMYLSVIDDKIKELKKEIDKIKVRIEVLSERETKLRTSFDEKFDSLPVPPEEEELEGISEKISILRQKRDELRKEEVEQLLLRKEKERLLSEIGDYSLTEKVDVGSLERDLLSLSEELEISLKREKEIEFVGRKEKELKDELSSLPNSLPLSELKKIGENERKKREIQLLLLSKPEEVEPPKFEKEKIEKWITLFNPRFKEEFLPISREEIEKSKRYFSLLPEFDPEEKGDLEEIKEEERRSMISENNEKILKKLNVSFEEVEETIERLSSSLSSQPEIKLNEELKKEIGLLQDQVEKLREERKRIEKEYSSFPLPPIEEMQFHHFSGCEKLKCPECNHFLILENGVLKVVNESPLSPSEEKKVSSLIQNYFLLSSRIEKEMKKIEEKKERITFREGKILSPGEVKMVETLLSSLRKVDLSIQGGMNGDEVRKRKRKIEVREEIKNFTPTIPEEDIHYLYGLRDLSVEKKKLNDKKSLNLTFSSLDEAKDELRKVEEYNRWMKWKTQFEKIEIDDSLPVLKKEEIDSQIFSSTRREEIEKQISILPVFDNSFTPSEEIREKVSLLRIKVEEGKKNNEKREKYLKMMEICLSNFDFSGEIASLTSSIERLSLLYPIAEIYHQLLSIEEEFVPLNEKFSLLSEKLEKVTTLRVITEKVRNQTLQEFVNSISERANKYVQQLFDDPISMELKLVKENKTGKIKNSVHLSIKYRGNIYDRFGDFSGGEKDRISLALTMALSIVAQPPILILDECLSSLDEMLREKCIKVLKREMENRTIINVCHSVVEGYHDKCIEI